jgi:hypothetical protein
MLKDGRIAFFSHTEKRWYTTDNPARIGAEQMPEGWEPLLNVLGAIKSSV